MKLSEFENITRETLHNRTIKPGDDVWDKLENSLSKQRRKRKLNFIFGAVAASIAFLLLIGLFVQNKTVLQPDIQTVETAKPVLVPGAEKESISNVPETKITVMSIGNTIQEKPVVPNKMASPEAIAEADKPQNTDEGLHQKTAYKNIIDQKVDEVVAQILDLKKNSGSPSDGEINALLADALKEIKSRELLNQASGKVDANALLADVEDEIDSSFKEKVLLALRESYQTVKTAVAQSNN